MKKARIVLLAVIVVLMIFFAGGCAFHNVTSWGIGDGPEINSSHQTTVTGRSARQ